MRRPLVTVAVPVFNGERHLAQACRSLLVQSLGDFELLIADNASTDNTPEICARLAEADKRVRVIRRNVNIGAPRNWNALVSEARGEFFKWATASDWCAPELLERCVNVLESDPTAVLAYAGTMLVDEDGHSVGVYDGDLQVTMPSAAERFCLVKRRMGLNNAQCGVQRTQVLRRTKLDRLYPSGDVIFTAEMALHGKLVLLEEVLNWRRQSPSTFASMKTPLQQQQMYEPNARTKHRLIGMRRHLDSIACTLRAPLSLGERRRALGAALHDAAAARENLFAELRTLVPFQRQW